MAKGHEEKCTCDACSPINNDVICQTMAQSAMRFNEGGNQSALMAINNQQNLQSMFNVKAQQTLERDHGERLAGALAQLGAVNARVGGIPTQAFTTT